MKWRALTLNRPNAANPDGPDKPFRTTSRLILAQILAHKNFCTQKIA